MKLKVVTFLVLSVLLSYATAWAVVPTSEVAKLYVATFNRAPDAGGLNHWANASGLTIEGIAKEFFKAPETQRKYPEGTTDEEFVNTIYQNVFGRDAEQAGIDYWADVLGKGWSTRDEMIMTVMGGAQNKDQQVLLKKTEVGLYYAEEVGQNHVDGYIFSLADITDDSTTVTAAKQAIDVISGAPPANPPGGTPVGLEADIEEYMAMISAAGELSPMMDEIGTLFGTIEDGDPTVVTITPDLQTLDLANLPPEITISADFDPGYTPEGSASVYTGQAVINITNLAFSESGITANAVMNATDLRRDGELVLAGAMTMDINVGIAGSGMVINIPITFSNLQSLDHQINGGVVVSTAVSGDFQLLEPVVMAFNDLTTTDFNLSGTVTLSQIAEGFDALLDLNTHEGPVSGIIRVTTSEMNQQDQDVISTPETITAGDYTVDINDVIMDADICPSEMPISGNIIISGAGETKTLVFNSNCTYTIN